MAATAAEEAAAITQQVQPAPEPTEPAVPAAEPGPISDLLSQPPPVAPPQPQAPPRDDAMLGRVEALAKQNEELLAAVRTMQTNQQFSVERMNETVEENRRLAERLAQAEREKEALAQAREVEDVAKTFQSDLVDAAQFAEIFKGVAPELRKRDRQIQEATARLAALEHELAKVREAPKEETQKLERTLLDRRLMQRAPGLVAMFQSPHGKEWLAQRIPGSRRTRGQEIQSAYLEGDEDFIVGMHEDFTRLGQPQMVSAEPQRTIVDQTPQAPSPEQVVDEEALSRLFQQMKAGQISRADFDKARALYAAQSKGGLRS